MQEERAVMKDRHRGRGIRLSLRMLCMAFALFILLGGAGALVDADDDCTVLDDCSGITGLPTAEECEDDDCTCAQTVECYVRNQAPLTNWPVAPGGELQLNRNFFHDRFIETRILPDAYDDWVTFSDPSSGPADFPDGTVIYKSGYLPSDDDYSKPASSPGVAYVYAKMNGYCPDDSITVLDYCLGGDWFSLEIAYEDYGTAILEGQLVKYGKEEGCFNCHSSASAGGDWIWKLYSTRRYP